MSTAIPNDKRGHIDYIDHSEEAERFVIEVRVDGQRQGYIYQTVNGKYCFIKTFAEARLNPWYAAGHVISGHHNDVISLYDWVRRYFGRIHTVVAVMKVEVHEKDVDQWETDYHTLQSGHEKLRYESAHVLYATIVEKPEFKCGLCIDSGMVQDKYRAHEGEFCACPVGRVLADRAAMEIIDARSPLM